MRLAADRGPYYNWQTIADQIAEATAAPDLLEACKAALAFITDDGRQGGPTWTIKTLREAIEKSQR